MCIILGGVGAGQLWDQGADQPANGPAAQFAKSNTAFGGAGAGQLWGQGARQPANGPAAQLAQWSILCPNKTKHANTAHPHVEGSLAAGAHFQFHRYQKLQAITQEPLFEVSP